ncbi:MAG: ferrochelatase [Castellaniella sp.]|uniref:ferrochelatase n=1 Tax=Castellaniella sp. TaxID=1955812 RepID=UPI002A3613B6|nr:ferrochelatase [Castellaniella sp.]MDY0309121.1 ferrochelatase [Castellaniella sp.]
MSRFLPEAPDPRALDPHAPGPDRGPLGVLLINLGTPDAPTPAAVRRYLGEFLSDPRVVELPAVLWQIILRLFVLTRRPAAIAPKYAQIWLDRGSPLLVYSQGLADGVAASLRDRGLDVRVGLAMRYGRPALTDALDALRGAGCRRILVAPMYPQYAASTTATAVDAVTAHLTRLRHQPTLRFLDPFPTADAYVDALYRSVCAHWDRVGKPDRLLLSFHGLPQQSVRLGDPYFRDCQQTVRALRARLGADGDRLHVAFQSRFGAAPWLQPYTQPTLESWGRAGVGTVDLMCPGFLADCLETLEEINVGCREAFLAAGGRVFRYIPCLNADPDWARGFAGLIADNLAGWTSSSRGCPVGGSSHRPGA